MLEGHKDSDCCENVALRLAEDQEYSNSQRRVLWVAFGINLGVFVVEGLGGRFAQSEALVADAVHLFSHVLVVLISLMAVGRSREWKARVAAVKALFVLSLGVNILFEAASAFSDSSRLPKSQIMSLVAFVAFSGNLATLWVLSRHRGQDLNMRSAWACSQVDLLSNLALVVASVLVATFGSGWPDAFLGVLFGSLIVRSSVLLLKQAAHELNS